jgi:predicted lactoylglutathione lyase
MALELYMLGVIVQDMQKSLAFYQRLGLTIPEGVEAYTHVEIKMENGLTFFLDSNPARWDPDYSQDNHKATGSYSTILEFYLKSQEAVEAKYHELTSFGYQGYRAPYQTTFGMCFAMIKDPDGNTILLSGDANTQDR